jgi:DNA topoisomerase-1
MKMRHVLCTLEPKYKKKAKYSEMESDIDDDWVAEHEADLEVKEIEKAQKKFEKENEKLVADGKAAQEQSELNERVKAIKDEFKRLKKEQGTGKATLKRERPVEKVEEAIEKLEERIATAGLQMVDRDEGKEVALGTRSVFFVHAHGGWWLTRKCFTVRSTILILVLPLHGARTMTFRSRSSSPRRC